MVDFIRELIGNDLWATIIMSLVPLIELKGGKVFARGAGFDFLYSLLFAYLGSTLVFFPIYFLLKPILNLIKKIRIFSRLAYKIEDYFNGKAEETLQAQTEKRKKKNAEFLKKLGVFIFVAIPLPMTGVWTGTAIAVFLNLKFKDAVLPIVLGNLVAGFIISILAQICITLWTIAVIDYILYTLFALAIILLLVTILKIVIKKPKMDK